MNPRARIRAAATRFADELADILGLPADGAGEVANDAAPVRRAKASPPRLRPRKDVSDVPETTRARARSILRQRGIRLDGDT